MWYFLGGRRHYKGPVSNLSKNSHNNGEASSVTEVESERDKGEKDLA